MASPVTYINDPQVVSPVEIVGNGTVYIKNVEGYVVPVLITGGSTAINLSPGDITIGHVSVRDDISGNETRILPASDAKASSESVLLVQHIDRTGGVLSQSSLANVDTNTAGIDTNTAASNVLLLDIVDTDSVHTGLLQQIATDSASTAAESLVIAQNVNAVTTAIQNFMYWEQSGSINSPVFTLLSNVTTPQDSPIADVSGYTLHAVQINISGSAVVQMQSSLDSQVWETDTVLLRSKYITTFGKYKYVRVRYRIGNGTVSAFAIASR